MKRLIIDYKSSTERVRVALAVDGVLEEVLVYSRNKACEVGDIFVGKVKNILPGLFIYVDIGLKKNAFLGLTDKKEIALFDELGKLKLKHGDDILVQVTKNPTGSKGANVTTQINYSNKYAIIFESGESRTIGISKKIEDVKEHERLKKIAKKIANKKLTDGVSLIIRTICENKTNEEIEAKIDRLIKEMEYTKEKAKYVKAPKLLLRKTSFINDLYTNSLQQIVVDDKFEADIIQKELAENYNDGVEVEIYDGQTPIFAEYFIESQFERAMNRRVWLKSGAFLIIERTEACYVIDVNTGKNVGKGNYKDTVFYTNIEAACEIAKQLRLRNLSGMIVIDFIDMYDEQDRKEVGKIFEEELKKDRITTNLTGINVLGLAVVTRKKTHEPLCEMMTKACPSCGGTGRISKEEQS